MSKSTETPKYMTPEDVRARVEQIRRRAGDDEAAHGDEDRLWENTLRSIVAGAPNPIELATEALKTTEIDFSRWCA